MEEAVQDAAIITCTILIHSAPAIVLFDYSTTHTFMSKAFVPKALVSPVIDTLG